MFEEERFFSFFDYEKLYKDFCYKRPFVVHFSAQNNSTKFQAEEFIQFKNNKCVLQDKIKVQRILGANGQLILSSGVNSYKFFYSHRLPKQIVQLEKAEGQERQAPHINQIEEVKAYAASYTDRKLQNASVQLGLQRSTQKTYINANITNVIYKHKNEYLMYAKMLYLSQKFKVGLLSILDIGSRNLQTNNLVFQFRPHLNHHFFVRGQVDGLRNYSLNYRFPKSYFDFFACNYIFKPTQTLTMMAELKYNVQANRLQTVQSLIEKTFQNRKLKVCLNHLGDITMQIGVPLSLGKSTNLDFGLLVSDFMKSRKISYGFKVNIIG